MHLDGMARARWRMQVYCLPRPDVPAGAGANAGSSDLTPAEGARLKKEAVLGELVQPAQARPVHCRALGRCSARSGGCGVCGAHLRDRLGPSLGCVVVLGASRPEHAAAAQATEEASMSGLGKRPGGTS